MASRLGAPGGSDSKLQLVSKAVEVLNVLAAHGELTAAEIAERMGEPRSSVYRLLSTLHDLELIEPGSKRGSNQLGMALVRLGSAVIARFDERRYALPVMERIHQETGETVFLCVRRENMAVCVERLDGRRVQSLALRVGGSLPLHMGAAPRALLANEPRSFWVSYVQVPNLEPITPGTPVTQELLFPVLEETLESGVAVSDGDVTPGIAALGVPIFDYRGQIRAALSISGVRPAILGENASRIRAILVAGGADISAAMGHERTGELAVNLG